MFHRWTDVWRCLWQQLAAVVQLHPAGADVVVVLPRDHAPSQPVTVDDLVSVMHTVNGSDVHAGGVAETSGHGARAHVSLHVCVSVYSGDDGTGGASAGGGGGDGIPHINLRTQSPVVIVHAAVSSRRYRGVPQHSPHSDALPVCRGDGSQSSQECVPSTHAASAGRVTVTVDGIASRTVQLSHTSVLQRGLLQARRRSTRVAGHATRGDASASGRGIGIDSSGATGTVPCDPAEVPGFWSLAPATPGDDCPMDPNEREPARVLHRLRWRFVQPLLHPQRHGGSASVGVSDSTASPRPSLAAGAAACLLHVDYVRALRRVSVAAAHSVDDGGDVTASASWRWHWRGDRNGSDTRDDATVFDVASPQPRETGTWFTWRPAPDGGTSRDDGPGLLRRDIRRGLCGGQAARAGAAATFGGEPERDSDVERLVRAAAPRPPSRRWRWHFDPAAEEAHLQHAGSDDVIAVDDVSTSSSDAASETPGAVGDDDGDGDAASGHSTASTDALPDVLWLADRVLLFVRVGRNGVVGAAVCIELTCPLSCVMRADWRLFRAQHGDVCVRCGRWPHQRAVHKVQRVIDGQRQRVVYLAVPVRALRCMAWCTLVVSRSQCVCVCRVLLLLLLPLLSMC